MTTPTADMSSATSPVGATPAQLLFGDLAQEIAASRRVLENGCQTDAWNGARMASR